MKRLIIWILRGAVFLLIIYLARNDIPWRLVGPAKLQIPAPKELTEPAKIELPQPKITSIINITQLGNSYISSYSFTNPKGGRSRGNFASEQEVIDKINLEENKLVFYLKAPEKKEEIK